MRHVAMFVGLFSLAIVVAGAHDGPLDSYGCHQNIAHGSYHCHAGALAERQYKSRADMLEARNEKEQERAQQERLNRKKSTPTRTVN
jgi:hypothetical protein